MTQKHPHDPEYGLSSGPEDPTLPVTTFLVGGSKRADEPNIVPLSDAELRDPLRDFRLNV